MLLNCFQFQINMYCAALSYESEEHQSLSNTTFVEKGWGWGGLRAGVLCLIHLSSQAVLHRMNGRRGGKGGAVCGRLTPAIVMLYCLVPT